MKESKNGIKREMLKLNTLIFELQYFLYLLKLCKKNNYRRQGKCKELFIKNTFDIVLISCNTIDAKYLKDLLEELISESQLEGKLN